LIAVRCLSFQPGKPTNGLNRKLQQRSGIEIDAYPEKSNLWVATWWVECHNWLCTKAWSSLRVPAGTTNPNVWQTIMKKYTLSQTNIKWWATSAFHLHPSPTEISVSSQWFIKFKWKKWGKPRESEVGKQK